MEIWEVEEGDAPIEGLLEDGSPDPAYAAALGLVQAPLGRRAAAFALEYAVYLLLQVPLLSPILHYTGVTYDEDGRVVDVARIRYRGDRFSFTVTVDAH